MNNGNIIGTMAVGALMAPVTGGISLFAALFIVSAGSIITKMGEEDTPQVATAPTYTPQTTETPQARARRFENGRLIKYM